EHRPQRASNVKAQPVALRRRHRIMADEPPREPRCTEGKCPRPLELTGSSGRQLEAPTAEVDHERGGGAKVHSEGDRGEGERSLLVTAQESDRLCESLLEPLSHLIAVARVAERARRDDDEMVDVLSSGTLLQSGGGSKGRFGLRGTDPPFAPDR